MKLDAAGVLSGPIFDDPGAPVVAACERRVEEAGELAAARSRSAAPVKSGETRDSVHLEGSGTSLAVVADSRAAVYVQFGYRRGSTVVQGRDFFYQPSALDDAQDVLAKIGDDIASVLE